MSFAFGWKNLFRNRTQSLSYILTIGVLVGITVFFIYLGNGLGFVIFGSIPQFNVTTVDLYSQFFRFMIYSSMVIAVVWILVINHSLIHHKTHDMAVMKGVGAIQKKLRSNFFSVIVLIDIIGIIIGLIGGFLLYLIFFFILSAIGFSIIIYIDIIFVSILVAGILLSVFVVNGYELWRLSTKYYSQIAIGDIPKSADASSTRTSFLNKKRWLSLKLAIRNLTRKRRSFYRVLLTTGLTLSIIVTLTTSSFIISSTSLNSIRGAQGGDTLIFGHKDVVNHYIERYEEFSNSSLQFDNIGNLTQTNYLMNESLISNIFTPINNSTIRFIDNRLFVYQFAREQRGYIYYVDEGQLISTPVGCPNDVCRTANVPVLGIGFHENYTGQWQVIGEISNQSNTAIVGDTLASELFDAAIYQSIRLENVTTSEFNITGIFYDSFSAGYCTYVHLDSLQQDFNLQGYVNLVAVGVSDLIDKNLIIQDLQTELTSIFGADFIVKDLTPTFERNIQGLYPFVVISVVIVIIQTLIIIISLFFYQTGNFQERAPDFAIIRGIGGSNKFIKRMIFLEDTAIILIASSISIGVNLVFNGSLLYQDAILPPLWVIFLIWLGITGLIIGLVRLSLILLQKELRNRQKEILKDFSRAK
jgi:ABC-type lipoprotein release transport system permease subunit